MRTSYWDRLVEDGCPVPGETPLDELTSELVTMLGDTDPHVRDDLGYGVLSTWIRAGVYDDLLVGLGDGLLAGLRAGLGEDGTPSVLRRSFSARSLAEVIVRAGSVRTIHPQQVMTWADRSVAWLLAERDLRGWIPNLGWSGALAHGADLLAALAASPHLGPDELRVLLDVVAERLVGPTDHRLVDGEPDRLALATMTVLHRDVIPGDEIEAWAGRLGHDRQSDEARTCAANVHDFVLALHTQLLLGVRTLSRPEGGHAPEVRADLLLALQDVLRRELPQFQPAPRSPGAAPAPAR